MQQVNTPQILLGAVIGVGLLLLGIGATVLIVQLLPVIVVVGGTCLLVKSVVGGEDLGK